MLADIIPSGAEDEDGSGTIVLELWQDGYRKNTWNLYVHHRNDVLQRMRLWATDLLQYPRDSPVVVVAGNVHLYSRSLWVPLSPAKDLPVQLLYKDIVAWLSKAATMRIDYAKSLNTKNIKYVLSVEVPELPASANYDPAVGGPVDLKLVGSPDGTTVRMGFKYREYAAEALRTWARAYCRGDTVAASLQSDSPRIVELKVGGMIYQIGPIDGADPAAVVRCLQRWVEEGYDVRMPDEAKAVDLPKKAPVSPHAGQKEAFQDGLRKGRAAVLQQIHGAREQAAKDLTAARLAVDDAQKTYDAAVDKVAVLDELLSQLDQE